MSETSEIINDCLIHYEQRHIQVRWDFYRLCTYDASLYNQKLNAKGKIIKDEPNQECMAKILRIIETLTDAKRLQWHMDVKKAIEKGLTPPKEPKEWGLELAYEAIVELLYHTYGESTVRNSIACLVERGYLKRYQAGNNTIPVYYLNISIVQAALKKLAEDSLVDVENNTHIKKHRRVLKTTPKRPNSTPKGPNSTPTGVENNSQASEFNTNNIYSNNTDNTEKEKEDISANADSARDISSSEQKDQVTDASKEIVPPENDTHSQLSPPTVDKQASSVDKPEKPKRRRKQRDLTAIEPVPPPEKPAPDALWNVVTCLQLADYYRGHTLTNGSYGMAQNEAISIIQQGCSYAEIDAVFRYMRCVDPDLKDDFWEDKTVDIWNVNKHREAKLKEIKRKTQKSPGKPKLAVVASNGVDYNAAIFDTSRNYIKGSEEELAQLEAQYQALKARKKEAAR